MELRRHGVIGKPLTLKFAGAVLNGHRADLAIRYGGAQQYSHRYSYTSAPKAE